MTAVSASISQVDLTEGVNTVIITRAVVTVKWVTQLKMEFFLIFLL